MSDDIMKPTDRLLAKMNEVAGRGTVYTLTGPCQLTVQKESGDYSKQKFLGQEEFFLKNIREGKRANYIFQFDPTDARPFAVMEMDERDMAKYLPKLLIDVAEHLTQELEGGPLVGFVPSVKWFLKQANKAYNTELLERAEGIKKGEVAKYADNPLWGSW